jgi:hypothetical protein
LGAASLTDQASIDDRKEDASMRFRQTKAVVAAIVLGAACWTSCGEDDEASACGDVVSARADPTVDLTRYSTFAVVPPESYPTTLPADVRTNLDQAVAAGATELRERGMVQVGANENPNLYLFTLTKTAEQSAIYWECAGGYYYGYWSWYWNPCTWITTVNVDYTVGTLIVGLTDPAQEKVVFGGAMVGVLECSDDLTGRIQRGIESVFASYPSKGR